MGRRIVPALAALAPSDGWGGVHPVGSAAPVSTSAYYPGWDVARAIALSSSSPVAGYMLDAFGGLHSIGAAAGAPAPASLPGQDVFRALAVTG